MSRQDNSDPLPYVQVDRAVKPKAVLLANALGVSTQHALGSLVEWWELCGDPRELETIVAVTKEGERPAVVLDGSDASLRFKLASGKDVEPVVLVRLGLLEPLKEGYRVRGMSRYFEPIQKRIRAREVARLGGLASASSRLKSTGSAQPVGGKGFEGRSDAGSTVSQAEPNRQPKRNRTDNGTETEPTTEAEPKPSGQRSAVSGHRPLEEEASPSSQTAKPPIQFDLTPPDLDKPLEEWTREDFWRWAECRRRKAGLPQERWPHNAKLRDWWQEARPAAEVAVLQETYLRFGDAPHWQAAKPPLPFNGFMSQWADFLPIRRSL